MATTVDTLLIDIKAETKGLNRGMQKVNRQLGEAQSRSSQLKKNLKGLGAALVSLGAIRALGSVINTIRTFEDLEATLRAVTGSAEAAAASFDLIRTFTATTTFQIEEVAEAFITLLQAGVTPTAEALQDFGNFAAGMGRSVTQLARATFNATTGEMEMLKQFGVIARQQGDQITVTFEGQTQVIERSGDAIVEYLRRIGRERFPTGISERANTLSGAISNLNDQISEFNVSIGDGGFREAAIELTKTTGQLIRDLDPFAKALGEVLGILVSIVNEAIKFIDTLIVIGTVLQDPVKTAMAMAKAMSAGEVSMASFRDVLEATNESIDDQSEKVENLLNRNEDLEDKTKELAEGFKEIQEAVIATSQTFTKDFTDSLLESRNALESFRDFAKNIVSQIIAIFFQLEVVNRILNAVFSGANLPTDSGFFGSGAETGGSGGGMVSLEPMNATNVAPMSVGGGVTASSGKAQAVTVVQNINFATGVQATVRNEVLQLMPQIADATKAAVAESAARGGRYRGALNA